MKNIKVGSKPNPPIWTESAVQHLFSAMFTKFGPYDPETYRALRKSDEFKDFCEAFGKTLKKPVNVRAVKIMINMATIDYGYDNGPSTTRYAPIMAAAAHWSGWKKLKEIDV